jgi:hypothetical protein
MALARGLAGLGLLVMAMFFDTLFARSPAVVGALGNDLATQFLPWRDFGFGELAKGNLALWNPHIYGGAPFFGGMQSALLYPPNWLYLALPLPLATNWSIALNVWLLGAFVVLWALRRGLHPFAAFLAAALPMFAAPHFLHVGAGHLTHLAAMPWVALLFLAIDEWLRSRRAAWCLLGMLGVALQIFAGHPQYVYYTALALACYAAVRLAELREGRLVAAAGLVAFYAGGAALAAVQLLTGLQATAETIRGQALPLQFAASFSFPPENLITLVAPGFFGDAAIHPYWGRWYLWESSAFIGVSGLALAAYGMTVRVPGRAALLVTGGITALLALGDHTPLFRGLYDWLPLFDRFRGSGKFIFFTALVLALFAGYGLDRILRERALGARAVWAAGALGLALFAGALAVRSADWTPLVAAMLASGEGYADARIAADPAFIAASQQFAALGLLVAAASLAAAVGLALWARREPRAAFLLGALAIAEVFGFARMHRPTFDAARAVIPQLRDFLAAHPGDYRILNLRFPNSAMSIGALDAWGFDPAVTRRYAEFIAWSEGTDPQRATQYVTFQRFHPLLTMLRVKYVVAIEDDEMKIVPGALPPLRRLELVGSHQVHAGRAAILGAMAEPSFDPRREVILERSPDPLPLGRQARGRASILREGTDFIEIQAELADPAVLLVTDAWAPGWRAVALPGSSRGSYELMPANYALRAVALSAGRHRLRMEYAPAAFRVGAAVSIVAWLAWIGAALRLARAQGGVAHA